MNNQLDELIERLVSEWRQSGLTVPGGRPLEEIEEFEKSNNIIIREDLKLFYSKYNGIGNGECDDHIASFWHLEELMPLYKVIPRCPLIVAERYLNSIVFADSNFRSPVYAYDQDSEHPGEILSVFFHISNISIRSDLRDRCYIGATFKHLSDFITAWLRSDGMIC